MLPDSAPSLVGCVLQKERIPSSLPSYLSQVSKMHLDCKAGEQPAGSCALVYPCMLESLFLQGLLVRRRRHSDDDCCKLLTFVAL